LDPARKFSLCHIHCEYGGFNWRLFLATGICGGFTTFSAFAWENLQLLNQQRVGAFISYTGATLVLGLTAVTIGYWITK
jgi:CrcB protein